MANLSPEQVEANARRALEIRMANLEAERDALRKQKRRNLLFMGAGISLLVHISIFLYLDSVRKGGTALNAAEGTFVEFAVLPEEELTTMETNTLEPESPDSLSDLSDIPEVDAPLDLQAPPAAELDITNNGSQPTLGGGTSGGDGDLNLGGGGTGVKFFDAEGQGTRFVFIVDVSGSMSQDRKMRTAMSELARSIDSLPDYAYFHVLLFETNVHWPPGQDDWVRARKRDVNRTIAWLDQISPGGGTNPIQAFARAFALEIPPDVIFFLTDGQIPNETPRRVAGMNRSGQPVVINTIAFGDPRSQDLLKEIADASGGVFRFVKVGGGP